MNFFPRKHQFKYDSLAKGTKTPTVKYKCINCGEPLTGKRDWLRQQSVKSARCPSSKSPRMGFWEYMTDSVDCRIW